MAQIRLANMSGKKGEDSPEYQAIIRNRYCLKKHLAQHLPFIVDELRGKNMLTEEQRTTFLSESDHDKLISASDKVISAVLLAIEIKPIEYFIEFTEVLERIQNKSLCEFIEKTVETSRKDIYMEKYLMLPDLDTSSSDQTNTDVFISYGCDEETNIVVDSIYGNLQKEGLVVFVDRHSLNPGDFWQSRVVWAIKTCKVFLAMLTEKYVDTPYCHSELYFAEASKKLIIPVVLKKGWDIQQRTAAKAIKKVICKIQHEIPENIEKSPHSLVESILKRLGTPSSREKSDVVCKLPPDEPTASQQYPLESFEQVHKLSLEKALKEITPLTTKVTVDEVFEKQRQFSKRLAEYFSDKNTVDIRCLKVFLVGPPGVGKTTTLNRLLKTIVNISSESADSESKANTRSTLLVNCIQALVFAGDNKADWLSSEDADEEDKLLIEFLHSCKPCDVMHRRDEEYTGKKNPKEPKVTSSEQHLSPPTDCSKKVDQSAFEEYKSQAAVFQQDRPSSTTCHADVKLSNIGIRLRTLIETRNPNPNPANKTLLHINDVGGQPGFLDMLPALTTGPAVYLVVFNLSEDLDKPYKIYFSRDKTIIPPYEAVHTVKSTISQILSSIASVHTYNTPDKVIAVSEDPIFSNNLKLATAQQASPLAVLVGTHKDKLVSNPTKEIEQIDDTLKKITKEFDKFLPSLSSLDAAPSFFSVDNYAGTEESDIGQIREFMNEIFSTHFREQSLPIRPQWLIFGTLLRREYRVIEVKDCVKVGEMLKMEEEEVLLCLRYLDCIGTLMFYTNISNWFKNHVICSPQVIFDSISQLIIASLRVIHSKQYVVAKDRYDLIKKGQFSLESIKKYTDDQVSELIPVEELINLMNHVNLLSRIDMEEDGRKQTTYFMPAVLECASANELTMPPSPDENNPEPLCIKFTCGYVPTGTFCGLITYLVSNGAREILGLKWKLVESGVKRNCISFIVNWTNEVMLLCHDKCYEVRVIRKHTDISFHDLCTYILTVILYALRSLYKHLVPQIAFLCPCSKHEAYRDIDNLCTLVETRITTIFLCGENPTNLRNAQQVWLGKHVPTGSSAELEALKFAEQEQFTFHWAKEGSRRRIETASILTFRSVSEKDVGYYRCDVKEQGIAVLTLYRALYKSSPELAANAQHSMELQLKGTGTKPREFEELEFLRRCNVRSEFLDAEIEEEHLLHLATFFDSVEIYMDMLGLTPAERSEVRYIYFREGTQVGMWHCLHLWRRHNPCAATLRTLLLILLRLRKEDIAMHLCVYYSEITHRQ